VKQAIEIAQDEREDPVKRAAAIIAVGKERRAEHWPVLRGLLECPEPFVRAEAVVVLVGIWADESSLGAALELLHSDASIEVRCSAADALGGLASARPALLEVIVGGLLERLVGDAEWRVQATAYRNLLRLLALPEPDTLPLRPFSLDLDVDWDLLADDMSRRGLARPHG
jgi:HEAT repeat protein